MKQLSIVGLALWLGAASFNAAELNVYFGNLHSHTSYSDGSGTPREAFKHARDKGKLDFLAVTEHNHLSAMNPKDPKTATGIASDHSLYNGSASKSLASAAKSFTKAGSFVALMGQEYSTIKKGNHANVFEIQDVIDEAEVPSTHFDKLLEWLDQRKDSQGAVPILQFNHPDEDSKFADLDYGAKEFGSQQHWVEAMSKYVRTIEMLCGPALKQGTGLDPKKEERFYWHYLNLGFRLAPTGDQDNHFRTWGTITDARTGIIAEKLTKADLLDAIRNRHVYATTDKNLRVIIKVNNHLCGDTNVAAPGNPGGPLSITFSVTDDDEPLAEYEIEALAGKIGGGEPSALGGQHSFTGNRTNGIINDVTVSGSVDYLYFKVTQSAEHGDDDVAWTAPVWFH